MAFRLVLTVVLLLMTASSTAPGRARNSSSFLKPGYVITVIVEGACLPEKPLPTPMAGAPQAWRPEGDSCLRELGQYLEQIRPHQAVWRVALARELPALGLTDVVVWGPDGGLFFSGRSGTTCVVGELGVGGYRVERVDLNADGGCVRPSWSG